MGNYPPAPLSYHESLIELMNGDHIAIMSFRKDLVPNEDDVVRFIAPLTMASIDDVIANYSSDIYFIVDEDFLLNQTARTKTGAMSLVTIQVHSAKVFITIGKLNDGAVSLYLGFNLPKKENA